MGNKLRLMPITLLVSLLFVRINGSSIVSVDPNKQIVFENSSVSLCCHVKITGNLTVKWNLPNTNSIQPSPADRFLNISAIKRQDAGRYECTVSNGTHKWAAAAEISVNYPPEITVQEEMIVAEFSNVHFKCNATGNPTPHVSWTSKVLNKSWNSSSFIMPGVNRTMSGIFYCKATNGIGNEKKASVKVDVQYKPEINRMNSSCGPVESWNNYDAVSLHCSAQGNPPPMVAWYLNGSRVTNESTLSSSLVFNTSRNKDFGNYTCKATSSKGEDLLVVRVLRREPAQVQALGNITATEGSVKTLTCTATGDPNPAINWTLPDGNVSNCGGNKCVYNITKVVRGMAGRYSCSAYNGHGAVDRKAVYLDVHYKPRIFQSSSTTIHRTLGTNVTLKCVAKGNPAPTMVWRRNGSAIDKQENSITAKTVTSDINLTLRSKELFSNYSCEATNSVGKDAVVFTISLNESDPETGPPGPVDTDNLWYYVGGATGGALLILIVVFIACVVWRRHHGNEKKTTKGSPGIFSSSATLDRRSDNYSLTIYPHDQSENVEEASDDMPDNVNYSEFYVNAHAFSEYVVAATAPYNWEYPPERLRVECMIGKGAFCQVAKGYSEDLGAVAVKMLKANSPEAHRRDLLSEVELMKQLDPHPNVVRLLGVITKSGPLMVMVEYIPYGDLLGYLRRSRGLRDNYYKNPEYKSRTSLTAEQLLRFARQTADGMAFLSQNKIIHRDLAARNVLVGGGETCKITDFGMARDVQGEDFYQKRTRGRLPVKWTAYEALCYGYYTTQSDVWSFGIVLYEIFTIGGCPYPDMDGHKIAYQLQEGYRMPKPEHVDNELYALMLECWITEPDRRPTFEVLSKTIARLESSQKPYLMMNKYDERIYGNIDDLG